MDKHPTGSDASVSSHVEDEEHFEVEQERDELKEIQKMAQRETNRVRIWKTILLLTILCAAALVTAGTYRILTDEEQDDFETSFDLFANTVQDGLRFHLSNLKLSADTMSNAISGSAAAYNKTFPFVDVADFEVLGQSARAQSGIELLWWLPYVLPEELAKWSEFSTRTGPWWIQQSRFTSLKSGTGSLSNSDYKDTPISPAIYGPKDENGVRAFSTTPEPPRSTFAPIWQQSPPPFSNWLINFDTMIFPPTRNLAEATARLLPHSVFGVVHNTDYLVGSGVKPEDHEKYHKNLVHWRNKGTNSTFEHPHCQFNHPVYELVNDDKSKLVGHVAGIVAWDAYLVNLLPNGVKGITVVLENTCNQSYTYDLEGSSAFYRGAEDLHQRKYNHMRKSAPFHDFEDPELALQTPGHCIYTFSIYPTEEFEDEYKTNLPTVLAVLVGVTFFAMVAFFFAYDWFVQSRNAKIVHAAARSNEIVSSMFPSQVRDKLFEQKKEEAKNREEENQWAFNGESKQATKSIAEFYPSVSIMFADIVGFTAWSSIREPSQVFELLETLYAAFDEIAKQRRIFKVETVGDCYVACAGVPVPRKDHAVAMARFARDCLDRMDELLKQLEVTLGPDTGDLKMRFGLHSGSVTAGVLRGDRARFQLFGDTMNTASRMESTGKANQVQLSHDTAELLKASGKGSWLSPREEMVEVKGKGLMVTYWLTASSGRDDSSTAESSLGVASGIGFGDSPGTSITLVQPKGKIDQAKVARLVRWNVEIMANILRQIGAQQEKQSGDDDVSASWATALGVAEGTVLDEVQEVINLPAFNERKAQDPIPLGDDVTEQLNEFIGAIAANYNDNEFHNFEHASHVTMSLAKLLSRVVNPKIEGDDNSDGNSASALHDFTYGITSDPLTQFACVLSAIVHDADHPGVPNATLIKENSELAQIYKKSIAEQNSFDLAWNLFMEERFNALRHAVCKGPAELKRFRQILVNSVMATDIMDKDLNGFRNQRWERAFGSKTDIEEAEKDRVDRKATIVIEHMIQASDVAHTMQHWHVYTKWNKRLFIEMYEAFVSGRSDKDPSLNWYEGEMGFFDFYIIPLAKKLAECGVFGVASSEYLDYAVKNRREWEDRGREVVAEMLEEAKRIEQHKMLDQMNPLAEETENNEDDWAASA